MKIKSENDLFDWIDADIAWRKKEIISLKNMLIDSRKKTIDILGKALVLISYSHWEGFVKSSTTAFLSYLSYKSFPASQLATSIRSGLYYWYLKKNESSVKENVHRIEDLATNLNKKLDVYIDDMVDTESNLNDKRLEKIASCIGLDINMLRTKYPFLNENLLDNRNHIAHGQYRNIEKADAINIADQVLQMIDTYKNLLENYISTKKYLALV